MAEIAGCRRGAISTSPCFRRPDGRPPTSGGRRPDWSGPSGARRRSLVRSAPPRHQRTILHKKHPHEVGLISTNSSSGSANGFSPTWRPRPLDRDAPAALAEVARILRDDPPLRFDYLHCITGVDYVQPDAKKAKSFPWEVHFELLYHLSSMAHRHRLVLRIKLPRWQGGVEGQLPEVPTVSHLWRTADWHEREVFDLSGVRFAGHPDLRRILCPEDWQGHPLRKDYKTAEEYHGFARGSCRCRLNESIPSWSSLTSARTRCLINMGPQHPSTHGVLRLVLRTDGEVVSSVLPHIGYLHQARRRSARTSARGSGFPTPTGWTTWRG